jgi:hypothetical protein
VPCHCAAGDALALSPLEVFELLDALDPLPEEAPDELLDAPDTGAEEGVAFEESAAE